MAEVEGKDKPELDDNWDPGNIKDGGWGNLTPGCCILDPEYITNYQCIYLSILKHSVTLVNETFIAVTKNCINQLKKLFINTNIFSYWLTNQFI